MAVLTRIADIALFFLVTLTISLRPSECANFSGKDITSTLFGSHNEEIFPVAYGDFNADRLTDVFAVSRDHSDLLIYFAREESPILRLGVSCKIRSRPNSKAKRDHVIIVGVSPGDFNGDGLLDVMVTFRLNEKGPFPSFPLSVSVAIFHGNLTNLLDCPDHSSVTDTIEPMEFIEMVQEPLMFDVNGDMIMDLFGEVYTDTNHTERSKHLWIFTRDGHHNKINFTWEEGDEEDYENDPLAIPSSNAYVDTDGDLVPELVFLTERKSSHVNSSGGLVYTVNRFRIHFGILGDTNPSFIFLSKVEQVETTQLVGQSLFIDLNQDGTLVHILPVAKKNGQSPALRVIPIDGKPPSDLPIVFADASGNAWHFLPDRDKNTSTTHRLSSNYTSSIVLRVGDFNLDGFPDLIGVLIRRKNSTDHSPTLAVIFENVPCEPKPPAVCEYPRTFRLNFDALSHYGNVTLATFFDIHEDGLVDVVLVRRTNIDEHLYKDTYSAFAIQNSPDYDANFMKVMVLSSRACLQCPLSGVPYGNILSGPVIGYKTTTQAGIHQTAIAAQLYRSSHMALDLPYTIFGIGQSPNFIETLRVSVSHSKAHNSSQEWPQIIPNSQIFVVPTTLDKPSSWTAKLFLTPSKAVLNTFGVLLGFCGFIALLVGGLQYKERRDDRKERLDEANRFHMM